MDYKAIHFSGHATIQLFKRQISVENIKQVIHTGMIIKNYPEDKPYPSFLILGFIENRPLHVVASNDNEGNCFIITAYEPELSIWNENFMSKKK